jgi:hypothetical protein
MSASLGPWWWQHIIVRGFGEHFITAEAIGSKKLPPCPGFNYIYQFFSPLKLCRRRFPSKNAFAVTALEAQEQTRKRVGIYSYV